MRDFFKRVKSQKGMSGVLVTMLLAVVGVALVAGVNAFMVKAQGDIVTGSETKISEAISNAGTTTTTP